MYKRDGINSQGIRITYSETEPIDLSVTSVSN